MINGKHQCWDCEDYFETDNLRRVDVGTVVVKLRMGISWILCVPCMDDRLENRLGPYLPAMG